MKRCFVDTPDGQAHCRIVGDGDPVFVLHQTPESGRAMTPFAQALAAYGFRVVAMDTLGYGESDRPASAFTTMSEFARSVASTIRGLGVRRVHLVGYLTGAQIALQTAAEHPDMVDRIVVQEAFNWVRHDNPAVDGGLHRLYPRSEDGRYLLDLWNRCRAIPDLLEREARFRDILAVNDDPGTNTYEGMSWEGAAPYAMRQTDIWTVTPKVQAPVMVSYIRTSQLVSAYDQFIATLPDAIGHRDAPWIIGDPAELAEVVASFLDHGGDPADRRAQRSS